MPDACIESLHGPTASMSQLQPGERNALPEVPQTQVRSQVIRFPAVFQPSGEPMLLTGNLITLGDSPVELAQGTIAETSSLVTGVCKVSAFKDELASNWSTFCAGPVKWIINAVPALKVCQGKECGLDCPHFHPAIEESIDQMVMDLWNRQFLTYEGKRVSQEQAEVFSVLIRVPASAVDQLQVSQAEGIYIEPRSEAGICAHGLFALSGSQVPPGKQLGKSEGHHGREVGPQVRSPSQGL